MSREECMSRKERDLTAPLVYPESWAGSDEEALERTRALIAKAKAKKVADAEERARAIQKALSSGISPIVLARAWSVLPRQILKWAEGGFVGDEIHPKPFQEDE